MQLSSSSAYDVPTMVHTHGFVLRQKPTPVAYAPCHARKVAVMGSAPHDAAVYLRQALIGKINPKISVGQTSSII